MDIAPYTGDLDLDDATTDEQLYALLLMLYNRAGSPSYRTMEIRARGLGMRLSKSKVGDIYNGTRFLGRDELVAFVCACGLAGVDVLPWVRAWERVKDNMGLRGDESPQAAQLDRLRERVRDHALQAARAEADALIAHARAEADALRDEALREHAEIRRRVVEASQRAEAAERKADLVETLSVRTEKIQKPAVEAHSNAGQGTSPGWPGLQPLQPANEVERELLRAAANNDHDLFLQTMAGAEVLLPTPEDMDYTLRPGRTGFPWQRREVDGATVVPVFTSPERLIEAARAAGTGMEYIALPFTVALRYWPHSEWSLVINPGAPAGGTILAHQLADLARWADQQAAQRMADGFEPQNDVEQRLFEAATRRDTDAFFKVLLGAQVLVPAEPETPWGIAPDDPEFPWRPVAVHGEVCVQLFTSLKWMNEAIGSSRFVMPTLLEMVSAWPDVSWTLVLNPGTPIDATMPGEQVRALSRSPRGRHRSLEQLGDQGAPPTR
ncbi:SseB family protein [Actinomadura terrae]|uniref:SseB family protein n=1 Tax=Actinomadura terrae TaxID=604353 RepID=UPI001FA7741D|nr:SseB family protein [Actinomadura terrae]